MDVFAKNLLHDFLKLRSLTSIIIRIIIIHSRRVWCLSFNSSCNIVVSSVQWFNFSFITYEMSVIKKRPNLSFFLYHGDTSVTFWHKNRWNVKLAITTECVCVCVCVCMYRHILTRVRLAISKYWHVFMYISSKSSLSQYASGGSRRSERRLIRCLYRNHRYTHKYMYHIYIYIYIFPYTYTHTYTHIHISIVRKC